MRTMHLKVTYETITRADFLSCFAGLPVGLGVPVLEIVPEAGSSGAAGTGESRDSSSSLVRFLLVPLRS